MDIIFPRVAGLDLHKKTIVATVRCMTCGGTFQTETRTFGTMTRDILALSDWLAEHGVTHVAMESTGVLWKPVWNILDGRFELLLVNPRELKQVPGRKSDIKDSQWIAQLLQHGLLRKSFVPNRPQRELRDLTRHRASFRRSRRGWQTASIRYWRTPISNWARLPATSSVFPGGRCSTPWWREKATPRSLHAWRGAA